MNKYDAYFKIIKVHNSCETRAQRKNARLWAWDLYNRDVLGKWLSNRLNKHLSSMDEKWNL